MTAKRIVVVTAAIEVERGHENVELAAALHSMGDAAEGGARGAKHGGVVWTTVEVDPPGGPPDPTAVGHTAA